MILTNKNAFCLFTIFLLAFAFYSCEKDFNKTSLEKSIFDNTPISEINSSSELLSGLSLKMGIRQINSVKKIDRLYTYTLAGVSTNLNMIEMNFNNSIIQLSETNDKLVKLMLTSEEYGNSSIVVNKEKGKIIFDYKGVNSIITKESIGEIKDVQKVNILMFMLTALDEALNSKLLRTDSSSLRVNFGACAWYIVQPLGDTKSQVEREVRLYAQQYISSHASCKLEGVDTYCYLGDFMCACVGTLICANCI